LGGEHGVVRLDHGGRDLRGGDGEVELALAAVVHGKALKDERAEAGAGAAARRVVHEEALEATAAIGELPHAVEGQVEDPLTHGVAAACVVAGRVLLAAEELLGVHAAVCAHAHFVDVLRQKLAMELLISVVDPNRALLNSLWHSNTGPNSFDLIQKKIDFFQTRYLNLKVPILL